MWNICRNDGWGVERSKVEGSAEASFLGIDASQLDNWRSVFRSAKEVLGTSSGILGIRRRGRDGFLGASQSQHKTECKAISSELLAHFKAEGVSFLSHIVTANETWVMTWHGTILNLTGRKYPENLRQRASSWSLPSAVAYPGILLGGGSTNSVEDRGNGDLGAVAP